MNQKLLDQVAKLGSEARDAEAKQIDLVAQVIIGAVKSGDESSLQQLLGSLMGTELSCTDLLLSIRSEMSKSKEGLIVYCSEKGYVSGVENKELLFTRNAEEAFKFDRQQVDSVAIKFRMLHPFSVMSVLDRTSVEKIALKVCDAEECYELRDTLEETPMVDLLKVIGDKA